MQGRTQSDDDELLTFTRREVRGFQIQHLKLVWERNEAMMMHRVVDKKAQDLSEVNDWMKGEIIRLQEDLHKQRWENQMLTLQNQKLQSAQQQQPAACDLFQGGCQRVPDVFELFPGLRQPAPAACQQDPVARPLPDSDEMPPGWSST